MQDDENKTLTQNGPRKRISLIGGSIRLASFLAKTCIINGHYAEYCIYIFEWR
jgi:hypothetical protein